MLLLEICFSHAECSFRRVVIACSGISTPIFHRHIAFHKGPMFLEVNNIYVEVNMYSVQVLCSNYLMANSHISFTYIMCVLKIHPLSTIFQGKTMETFNTVCSDPSFRCYIFLGTSCHGVQQFQKGFSMLRTFQGLACAIWNTINFLNVPQ